MSMERVLDAIPHRPPFLWVDEVVEETDDRIVTRKLVDPEEPCFRGHYPDSAITPGVLVCEAIFQAGAILLSARAGEQVGRGRVPVLTRVRDARFKRMVLPGETITCEVTLEDELQPAFHLKGKATVAGELAVSVSFSCALAPRPSAGGDSEGGA